MHHIEKGCHARQDVLGRRRRRCDDRIVIACQSNDELCRRLGQTVFQRIAFSKQNLAHAFELGGCIGGSLSALACNQNVHVAADLGSRSQRLGGLVGKGCIVMFGNKKNSHCFCP
ncbi:Uncharacterised protein [Brucella melitensis]|nr:Uncharacterised protein [Brucella melitensis]